MMTIEEYRTRLKKCGWTEQEIEEQLQGYEHLVSLCRSKNLPPPPLEYYLPHPPLRFQRRNTDIEQN